MGFQWAEIDATVCLPIQAEGHPLLILVIIPLQIGVWFGLVYPSFSFATCDTYNILDFFYLHLFRNGTVRSS